MARLLPSLNVSKPLMSWAQKTLNRLVGERDWSAQEVCHLLLNLPLSNGTRVVQFVDCRPESIQSASYQLDDGGEALSHT